MTTLQTSLLRRRTLLGALALVLLLGLLAPLGVALASPSAPVASLNGPTNGFIGEPLSFSVSFDNADTTDPGYGPYVDLILPAAGVDGAGAAIDDGITFNGATYLGTTLTPVISPFICTGSTFTHPLTGLATACANDTQIVILQLPFGSFTATQPPATINVSASLSNLADVGTALSIQARAGFAYGNDPLINPVADPPIIQSTPASAPYTPLLFKLKKTYLGPEDETATGPNYPRQYRIDVDIATGQTITNLNVSDILPNNMQFVSVDSLLINNAAAAAAVVATPSTTVPGGTVTRRFASVAGTAGTQDASVIFTFYIPRLDTVPAVIIDPLTGDDVTSLNNASTGGNWTPIDVRDLASTPVINPVGPEHTLTDKSIAIQKSVSNKTDADNTPNDVLEYTLDVQISDFFALDCIVVDDTFSDGQHFDPSFPPLLQVNGNTYILPSAVFNATNFTVTPNYTPASPLPNDGTTAIQFRVSNEIITRGQDGRMIGGCVSAAGTGLISPCNIVNGSGDGPTTARITFRTIIQDEYTDTFPSGDKSVDEGDLLNNDVIVTGNVLKNVGLTPTGSTELDDSHAQVAIARGTIAKTIYAVNGVICAVQPCTNATIQPGDTITYRVQRDLPSSDIEGLALIDYLPLPIFDVDDNSATIKTRITSFDTTVSATLPPPGTAKFGPADTFFALSGISPFTAATANDSIANSVTFNYGAFDSPANPATTIDILLTVTANSAPFGDGLFLTNQLHEVESSTNNGTAMRDAIVQVKIFEPAVRLRKGVIAAYASTSDNTTTGTISPTPLPAGVTVNAPGVCARTSGLVHSNNLGTTFDSNLTGVDAGARVTFAIVIENTGTSQLGLFDARLRDVLPAGFSFVPASLCVTDGTGAAMAFTTLGGGLFDPAGGIELTDPGPTAVPVGALDPGKNLDGTTRTDGRNIAIATFDATSDITVAPNQTYVNNATLYNYSSLESGIDHTPIDRTDSASVTMLSPIPTKSIVSTSEAHTSEAGIGTTANPRLVAIGEIVRYRMLVEVPEGTLTNLQLLDTLPGGLTFLNDGTAKLAFVANGGGIASSTLSGAGLNQSGNDTTVSGITPTFVVPPAAITPATFNDSTDPTFSLGNVVNTDGDADKEYAVLEFNALINNTTAGSNDAGDARDNNFSVRVNGTSLATSANVRVRVVEPAISVAKSVSPATGDAGDTINYSVTFSNASGANNTTAFDLVLIDALPAQLTNVTLLSTTSSGTITGLSSGASGNTITVNATSMATGASVTVTYSAQLTAAVTPGQSINNTAGLTYTSLPSTNGTIGNPTGSNNTGAPGTNTGERTGSGTPPNDLLASDTKTVTVFVPNPVKSLVATSESHTTGNTVVVGEVGRFRMVVRVAEGNSPAFELRDNLPTGLRFLNDSTTKVALVSTDPGLTSSTLSGAGLLVLGNETTVAGVTPTFVLPTAAISGGTGGGGAFQSGDDPLLALGNFTNTDSDADQEFVVVEFNALVENAAGNQNAVSLDNTFTARVGGSDIATSNIASLTVAEPNVTITKRVLSTTGSTVTYQVVATNTGSVTAFDAIVRDVLPAALDLNVGSITIATAGGATSGTANHSDPANRVEFNSLTLPSASSLTITYQATILTPGTTIANTATSSYTSLPGANGTTTNPTGSSTPGTSGTSNGERDNSGGINDYGVSATTSLGSLGDNVWYDVDADGVLDAGEVGIPGVTVAVRWFGPDGVEGNGDDSVITTTTGSAGNYLVSGLPLGTGAVNYRVTVNPATLPNGLTNITYDLDNGTTSPNGNTVLVLSAGNANPRNADFGYRGAASLGDRIWLDSDGNGAQGTTALEPGLPTVGVTLVWFGFDGVAGGGDDVTYTTTTNAAGAYGFANLPAGNFRTDVNVATLPTNVTNTYDLDGTLNDSAPRTLAIAEAATDLDFGYRGAASIGDTVWNDVDANGVQNNAEPGIVGATVTLRWAGPDSVLNNADDVLYTTTTNAGGTYAFPGLPVFGADDPYRVTVAPPPVYTTQTYDSDGIGTASQSTLNLSASEANISQDFGYRAAATQGLSNFVWEDLNGNGLQDGGEPGLDGVAVKLYDSAGTNLLATITTAGGGFYSFPGLIAGNYQVHFDVLPGYARTVADSGVVNDTIDSDADKVTGFTGAVPVTAGAFNTTVDAGLYRPVTIGDLVWYDIDGDGLLDAGEPGIGGATVTVTWYGPDGVAGGGDDATYITTTTSTGAWTLVGVPPGAYGVAISTLPVGLTVQTSGISTFMLVSGVDRTDIDFGYTGSGSLGDQIWLDSDSNGALNGTEEGIGGVPVNLIWAGPDGTLGNADDVTMSTTTAPDGSYSFLRLPAGSYQIDIVTGSLPSGVNPTYDLDGVGTPSTVTTSLAAGQNRTDTDFGYVGTGSLGNYIWLDIDGDGVQDPPEEGIGNVTVTLTWYGLDGLLGNGDDIGFTTTTDGNGAYSFNGLPAGQYEVAVTPPAGTNPTYDLDGVVTPSVTTIALTAGQSRTDADFGYRGNASIGDLVWFDSDGDGVQDAGEPGLPGVDVTLIWAGPDGVFGGVDDITFNATTGATGAYNFANLPPGDYSVDVDQGDAPSGTILTTANDPLAVSLSAGQAYTSADFGFTGAGSLGNFVWLDRDGDGVQDAGEPGISGTTVNLIWAGPDGNLATAGDNINFTTSTSASGAYTFPNLPAGPFRVTVDTATLPSGLNPTYDLDLTANSTTDTSLTVGQNRTDVDFGYQGSGSIGDLVWFDSNGDGVRDAGEPGISPVDVTLTWAGADGVFGNADDATFMTMTNATGGYNFAGLPAGNYSVDVDQADAPAGTAITTANDPATVALTAGQNRVDVDFGFSGSGSLGDFIWLDRNGDGVQDAGEPGLPGVTVTVVWGGPDGDLATPGDNVGYTTTTDVAGVYSVMYLPIGSFTVTISGLPGGVNQTFDPDGALDNTTSTSLTGGQNRTDMDFGYQGTGSIGDRVWSDIDGDGAQDAGEPGLVGLTINLTWYGLDGAAGGGDDLTFTTITGANGAYSFTNLPAGNYSVDVDQATAPIGTTLTTANDPQAVTLAAGQAFTSADFGFLGATSLGDFIWLDLDGDGVQDAGEPGIGGVAVTLIWAGPDGNLATTADNATYTTTTNGTGAYTFIGVPPGNYSVDVAPATLPGGVTPTYDLDGTASASNVTTALAIGQTRLDVDFGYRGSGSIGDFVWFDRNGDGVQDASEPGLPNVTINLTWAGPDGTFGTSDDATLTQATNLSGGYSFTGLPMGDYRVDVDQTTAPAGMILTTANDPLSMALAAGQAVTNADFGFTGTGVLGDRIWNDLDGDGVQDPSESGIAGVTVTLIWAGPDGTLGTADDVTTTTTTDLNGSYGFGKLPAGNYKVDISGAPIVGLTPTADPDGIASASTATTKVAIGQNRADIDFGYRDPAPAATGSIGDRLWVDANGNGAQDAGETGLANVDVRLIAAGPDGLFGSADDLIQITPTDALGNYSFTTLLAGSYRVQVDASDPDLAGYVETAELDGSLNGIVDVTLATGENRIDLDFGYRSTTSGGASGSIGDRVWNDVNGDGVQDAGESGIAGVTVTLTAAGSDGLFGSADDSTATTTTDVNGAYTFAGLPAGNYRVTSSGAPLASLNETYELDGSRDNSVTLSLATGQAQTNVDFGYTSNPVILPTGAIGDQLWLDLNGDGTQNPGEQGLSNVTVVLTGPGGVTYTQVTDASGKYNFPNLPVGSYVVTVDPTTLPAGLTATYDLDGGNDGSASVTIAAGQVRTDLDFGYAGTASLGDWVWNDADGDRIEDVGEAGIAGVPVALTWAGLDGTFGTADDSIRISATDASGYYRFNNLPAGNYRVSVDTSAPALAPTPNPTYELDGTLNGTTDITLMGGQNRSDVDFGFTSASTAGNTASIGDRLWLDLNGNGAQDAGEPGLAGITVNLISAGADGLFGTADDVLYTQVTGPDGSYNFTSLPAGAYRIAVDATTLPGGLTGTKERDATIDGSTDVTLNVGDVVTDADFGYLGVGSLGDRIWFDKNGDGVQDSGEPGIGGVAVTATWYGIDGVPGGGDDLLFATTTNAIGGYNFTALPLGNYGVTVGAGVWSGTVETAELDSTLNGSTTVSLTLAAPVRTDVDFGYTGDGAISQTVWRDADRNGIQDPGEGGISGVVITLVWAGPDGLFGTPDDVTYTTATDANGQYQFPNLPAGNYTVRVDPNTLPPDLFASYDKDGGNDSLVTFVLAAGQIIPDINFGYGPAPTAITLASFTATWQDNAVDLRWETTSEINTWGFSLYRSATGARADAVRITSDLILSQGRGQGGAVYSWSDTTVQPGETYVYWLVETEVNGTTNEYGPARALPHTESSAIRVFLPLMLR